MRIYKKKVEVKKYEDKECGFETTGYCKSMRGGGFSLTHGSAFRPPHWGPAPREASMDVTFDIDGQKIHAEFMLHDLPDARTLFDILMGANKMPSKLRISFVDIDAEGQ